MSKDLYKSKGLDNLINLLWLSDIHFNNEYTEDKTSDSFKYFVDSFLEYANTLNKRKRSKFDYLLISGDIAQSGEKEDYELFKKVILDPLLNVLSNKIKLLIVPGNHDVKRSLAKGFVNKFLSNSTKRLSFLKEETEDFKGIFNYYSKAFKDYDVIPSNYSSLKKNNLLLGYVLDKEKKVLFILLNSSWYSIGDDGFLKTYMEEFVFSFNEGKVKNLIKEKLELDFEKRHIDFSKFSSYLTGVLSSFSDIRESNYYRGKVRDDIDELNIKEESFVSKLEEILRISMKLIKGDIVNKVSKISNEYGKQLVGLGVFEDEVEKILELTSTYNDYVVTTIMHHPINWLDWDERIPYGKDKFHEIKKHTDLLLTGHEHVPKGHKAELMNNKELLHIQAGCFMNFQNPKDFKINDNWFSTLQINVNKRTVKQDKHYCETKEGWKQHENGPPRKLDKKHTTNLSAKRKEEISKSAIDFQKLLHLKELIKVEDGFFCSKQKTYIFINNLKDTKFGISFDDLKRVVINNNSNKVCFVFMDTEHECYEDYCKVNIDKMKVLDIIKNDFDFKFDKFRHLFFSSLDEKEVVKFNNLKFMNIIKPYWEIEACLCS